MEYLVAAYLILYFVKLPMVLAAAYRDTTYSVKQGYLRNTPWKVYMLSLMAVAAVMSFVMLVPMLVAENVRFFRPYRRDIIEKVADKAAETHPF